MPTSWRTDTFRSGMPGTPAWAWAGISRRFRMFFLVRPVRPRGMAQLQPVSNEPSLFQIVIGLDNFAQLVLRPRIAPIGVGVMALHQLLEPGFDLLARGRRTEI